MRAFLVRGRRYIVYMDDVARCAVELLGSGVEALAAEQVENADGFLLAEQVAELRRLADRLEAEVLRRVRRIDDEAVAPSIGYPSTSALLRHRCRLRTGRARRMVADARRLASMPLTDKLYTAGDLSTDQVRILIQAAETEPEAFDRWEPTLADTAHTVELCDDLAAVVALWRQQVHPLPTADERQLFERRAAVMWQNLDGMTELWARFTPEVGARIRHLVDAATAPPRVGDGRSAGQRRADALADLLLGDGGGRTELVVHTDLDTLTGSAYTMADPESGGVFGRRAFDQACCDPVVTRVVFGPEGQPVDVGRTRRVVPGHLRKAVVARDRRCAFPGCARPPKWCDVHHVVPWSRGGETNVDGLVLLCRFHHTLTHLHRLAITWTGDGWSFTDSDGRPWPPPI